MILKRIYEEYNFNIEKLLIKEYKRLNLTIEELNVLIVLFALPVKKNIFSLNDISKKVDYNQNEIAKIIESLMEKNFLKIKLETSNKREREVYDLDGTFDQITKLYEQDEINLKKEQTFSNVSETIALFEEKMGRMLKSNELDRIRIWYESFNYGHSRILSLINASKKNLSVIYIEKLLNMNVESDIKIDDQTEKLLDDIFKKL
ncbi:DnaD domain protein [Haploplasma axanthum]|uniref:Uncharacterized protein n=1 Tax=Haploplasma axanthum TaxID=29552 RepID=A0A449BD22_HAPAX|nr:DnaD domain protein [Haploplasma axanthum]VEU80354.1 Uncharacterised protein [Haploplasma axanthum]